MATLKLTAADFILMLDSGQKESHDYAKVMLTCGLDALGDDEIGFPYLRFGAAAEDGPVDANARALFSVRGYEEIDALRRYCEMTLELYRDGRLE